MNIIQKAMEEKAFENVNSKFTSLFSAISEYLTITKKVLQSSNIEGIKEDFSKCKDAVEHNSKGESLVDVYQSIVVCSA